MEIHAPQQRTIAPLDWLHPATSTSTYEALLTFHSGFIFLPTRHSIL